MSKNTSRATKIALAAVLTASATIPTLAAAETATTTAAAVKTIDFTVEVSEQAAMLKNFIKSPGFYVEIDGKKYVQLDASASLLKMITAAKVGETSILTSEGEKKVLIPLTDDFAPVTVTMTLQSEYVNGDYTFVLTADKNSIKDKEEVVEQPAPTPAPVNNPHVKAKDLPNIVDGIYNVKYDAYKDGLDGYAAITRQLPQDIKLEVKDGKYYVLISPLAAMNDYVLGLTINGKEAELVEGTDAEGSLKVYRAEIPSLTGFYEAEVLTHRGDVTKPHGYAFGFALETDELVLPTPVYVYEDGKINISNMQDYISPVVNVATDKDGYTVQLTFTEGQYLEAFDIPALEVTKASETKIGESIVKVYTIEVDDLSKMYDSTMTISVPQIPGYNSKAYEVQIQFGGEAKTPFTDIESSWAKPFIKQLYGQKVFKYSDKFNPKNKTERYQFALMLQRSLNFEVPAKTTFTDIDAFDSETVRAIKALSNIDIIKGKDTAKTVFDPKGSISRQDTAIMINRVLEHFGYEGNATATISYEDVTNPVNGTDYQKEAYAAIAQLNELNIMTGKEGNKFDPKGTLTREEMSKVLVNTLKVIDALK